VLRIQPTAFCDIARGLEITAIVLFAFSLATASVFVLNQYFDREADRENEVKSNLPVALDE
jgi:4-hydroxybenzoate polyprenyltransferase